ncbi:hypothetical protein HA402_008114 [Bradysia odoriphaga]|nr:hypothetical protein HA402_008114 [Bradysia odoriphaga]
MSYDSLSKIYKIDFVQLVNRPKIQNVYTTLKPMLKRMATVPNLGGSNFSIQHDSFYSLDGSNVPLTVIQKKNNDPNKPCLVFSYGGFNVPMLPQFKLIYLLFIELFNGIVVIIYIRGGGELGDDWRLKASEAETSFNDLIAGVNYLKSKTYKNVIDPNKIAFLGISHGGVTGAVAINKRRDLFRAVILQNANVDLIHDLPLKGRHWAKQYGDLKIKEDYEHIKRYAPLLHINEPKDCTEAYPTTLVVASRFDEIVNFANSLKYVALRRTIAAKNEFQNDKPVLLKVINTGGHAYESAEKREFFDVVISKLRFLAQAMDLKLDAIYQ